jgi:oligopeptide transport system ATP-binding protein
MEIGRDSTNAIPLLKIEGLCKSFQSNGLLRRIYRAVDNVDMEVNCGEIHGIVGESGSGKTTLARCSLRLIEPSAGSIYSRGQDLSALSPAVLRARRKDFQMIFQDPFGSLNPEMTIEQILLEPLQIHSIGDKESRKLRIRELLDAVSLSESLLNRKPSELSGGQQQRVGIARGLILKPHLVVADEPVSALDASVQAQILNLIAKLKKQYDLTLILISHSLNALHYLCTHISVMYKGRIVEEAPSADFFKEPKHPYSQDLLRSSPSLDSCKPINTDSLKAISAASEKLSGCSYYAYCSFRLSECARRVPVLTEVRAGEAVACFLYSQTSAKPEREIE